MSKIQTGILNRPPEHARWLALNVVSADPPSVRAATEAMREIVRREQRSDLDDTTPSSPKDQPSAETGELGW